MLRQNGGCNVVVAAPEGLKMELAKKLGAGDVITLIILLAFFD
jgi:D-arabinitol dehydrogenase (NADP+)